MDEPAREEVVEMLKTCCDPEIPVNIVDLGLVYELRIQDGHVFVAMTLTAPGCPMGNYIVEQVRQAVMRVKGVRDIDVELVFEPPWTPERMTEEAKKAVGL